jgi:hypothetical protein
MSRPGNLNSLSTTSSVVADVSPVDYLFQNPSPEAEGTTRLTAGRCAGRLLLRPSPTRQL